MANPANPLWPEEELADLRGGETMAAYPPEPSLRLTRALAAILEAGIREVVNERDNFELDLKEERRELRRWEKVSRVYIRFVELVSEGDQDGDAIREAAKKLLAAMY